ncbi:MAG: glycosyltransferase family 2 protein [Candidatus Neomarinimicrobiota bacterium]
MLARITPVVLTRNEEANIGRCLKKLTWAGDVVVVDSFSSDNTVKVARDYENVRIFQRRFDSHENQWNFALTKTDIDTEWVMALDADYILTDELVEEIRLTAPNDGLGGYWVDFAYATFGKKLRGGIYPPNVVLFKKDEGRYIQDGHTQRLVIDSPLELLTSKIIHDDRKPLSHWFKSQLRYQRIESEKLSNSPAKDLSFADRLRKLVIPAPFLIFLYVLFVRRAILDGWAGWFYAFQRFVAELMLSLLVLERLISSRSD